MHSVDTTQGLFMPFLSCHFPSNTKYNVLILYASGVQPCATAGPNAHDQIGPQAAHWPPTENWHSI